MKEKELERLTKLKEIENELYNSGIETICGIDEAGRDRKSTRLNSSHRL